MNDGAPIQGEGQTLTTVLSQFEGDGYTGQFRPLEAGLLQCLSCREEVDAWQERVVHLRRLEGASDPADMAAVAALDCPACGARGTLVVMYGPEASAEESDALAALDGLRTADAGQPECDPEPSAPGD